MNTNVRNAIKLSDKLAIFSSTSLAYMRQNKTTNVHNAVKLSDKIMISKPISLLSMNIIKLIIQNL